MVKLDVSKSETSRGQQRTQWGSNPPNHSPQPDVVVVLPHPSVLQVEWMIWNCLQYHSEISVVMLTFSTVWKNVTLFSFPLEFALWFFTLRESFK